VENASDVLIETERLPDGTENAAPFLTIDPSVPGHPGFSADPRALRSSLLDILQRLQFNILDKATR
jgi:hypothetical protein